MIHLSNLEPEIRDEFQVTTDRKQIWACLLDLLAKVDAVCKKYSITYYAIGGTLLGAVRHRGFIPWDDDLDIAMMRKDYNRFLEVAPKEIRGKYFFQTTLTDQDYYKEWARIRNSETTGIHDHNEMHKCNNGIYLDIFPLENYSPTFRGKLHQKVSMTLGRILTVKVHHNTRPRNSMKSHIIYGISFLFNIRITHRIRERMETRNANKHSRYVTIGDVHFETYSPEKLTFERTDFDDVVYLPFEDGKIPCPSGYDNILKTEYGDYLKFPPVEKRGLHHRMILDPCTPYKEYIERHRNELVSKKTNSRTCKRE